MSNFNEEEYLKKEIEWYYKQVKWHSEQIVFNNKELKKARKEDKEFLDWVWSKGPVTEIDARIYNSSYKSEQVKRIEKERRNNYKWRKKYQEIITNYKNRLLELA